MIRSIKTIMRQDREPYRIPRRVQDVIPIQCVWPDGIFKVGIKFSKTYRFTDINYKVAGQEDKETMFRVYSELLNSLDCAATTKLTICNRRQSQADFEQSVLMPMREDGLDKYRREYNQMLMDKATGANGITQEKYVTITVYKRDIEDARAYFTRVGADLAARFAASAPSAWSWTPRTGSVFSTISTGPETRAIFILIWRIWPGRVTTSRTTSARTGLRSTVTI